MASRWVKSSGSKGTRLIRIGTFAGLMLALGMAKAPAQTPEEFYKEAYHSIAYIAATWSRYFDVLEYVETKHQDMVVLRRT